MKNFKVGDVMRGVDYMSPYWYRLDEIDSNNIGTFSLWEGDRFVLISNFELSIFWGDNFIYKPCKLSHFQSLYQKLL